MIPDTNGKPESRGSDADQIAKLLEIELAQKKLEWAAATERYQKIRTASFLFLALVIIGAMVGFFFVFTYISQQPKPSSPETSAKP